MNFFLLSLIKAAVVAAVLLTTLAYLQWVERKVIAHIQVRMGPSRVGPHGLLQPLADVIKLITKEDLIPPYVNKLLSLGALAPRLAPLKGGNRSRCAHPRARGAPARGAPPARSPRRPPSPRGSPR